MDSLGDRRFHGFRQRIQIVIFGRQAYVIAADLKLAIVSVFVRSVHTKVRAKQRAFL
ncbi:MAG: hypothetical protein ACRETR_13615 [Steroidobacteraceae bacterium]